MNISYSDSACVLGTLLVLRLVPYLHPMQFWVTGGQKSFHDLFFCVGC